MVNKSILSIIIICFFFSACGPVMYPHQMSGMESVLANKKMAIMPCNLFYENHYSKNKKNKKLVQDSITTALERMGFNVVDQELVDRDIDSIMSTFKPFYDPKTGELDTVLTGEFRKCVVQHFSNTYNTSGLLFPYLRMAKAYISGGYSWDGRLIKSFMLNNMSGSTTALSLYVRIFDGNNRRVFDNAGGIQVLGVYVPSKGVFQGISDSEILKDPNDLYQAVEIVFKPINEYLSEKK